MPEATPAHRGLLARFFHDWLGFEFVSRIYLYSVLIGIVSGLGAVLFIYGLELAKFLLTEKIAGFHLYHLHGEVRFDFSFFDTPTYTEHLWLLLLLPAIGGLAGGYLAHRFAPEAEGAGTDAMIDAFHNNRGQIRPIVAPVKALTTIITLASGRGRRPTGSTGADRREPRIVARRNTQTLGQPAADPIAGRHRRGLGRNLPRTTRRGHRQRRGALPRGF